MIAHGAAFERTIEALALLVDKVEPDLRCAIATINSDGTAFSNVFAPSLPRPCKVRLLQMPVGPPVLNPKSLNANHHSETLCADLAGDERWNRSAWARALSAEGFRCCLFVPIPDSKRRPLAVFSLLSRSSAEILTSNSTLAQTVIHLSEIALKAIEESIRDDQLRTALNTAELARREAESAARATDQLLAVLSHELRTPLTPIMMAASWLRNSQEISQQARNAFDMIFRNVELEARLIDDLLDLTRIARNQLELQFRVVDLHTVLRAAIEVCETDVQEKKQSLNLQLAAIRAGVQCDVARVQQVFWNLLKNAIKFTPAGGVIFVTSRNENNDIVVEVSDSGIGIDPRIIPKIFVPFEQGDKDIVKQFGGLGLGLAISKAIIDAHRGAIAVHSEGKDLGAAFTVRLRLTSEPGTLVNVVE